MSITEKVAAAIAAAGSPESIAAIERAERLADQYADIKPVPYIVPIERYVGMPLECNVHRTLAY